MLAEAAARFGLSRTSLVNWLQNHRNRITELGDFSRLVHELCGLPLAVLPLTPEVLPRAALLAQSQGLLTNDAITLAMRRDFGISHILTNDDDFDGVSGMRV